MQVKSMPSVQSRNLAEQRSRTPVRTAQPPSPTDQVDVKSRRQRTDFKSLTGWGERDVKMLDEALAARQSFEHVDEFHQGQQGNCASIAVIKAAMDTFGNQVFQNVETLPDGSYRVTMRDGYTTVVSPEQLQATSAAGDFEGADSQQESYATLLWAAMANRAGEEGFEGATNFEEGLAALQSGAATRQVPQLLGLQDYVEEVDPADVANHDAVVGIARRPRGGHAVYIDQGQVDLWGRSEEYSEDGFGTYDYTGFFRFNRFAGWRL